VLDGTVTNHEHFRRKGQDLIEQARENRLKAKTVRALVAENIRDLQQLSNFALTPVIQIKNPRGIPIEAAIIIFAGPDAVVRRSDGVFFQFSMQDIAASYAPLLDMVRVAEFGRMAGSLLHFFDDTRKGVLIFSDITYLWFRSENGDVEQIPNTRGRDLQFELFVQLNADKKMERAAEIAAGDNINFVVNRILSFKDFVELRPLGNNLYEVAVGLTKALLITTRKGFVSMGRGELRVQHVKSMPVMMVSGRTENLAVMIETPAAVIAQYEDAVNRRIRSESLLNEYEKNRKLYNDLVTVKVGAVTSRASVTNEKKVIPKQVPVDKKIR
jgi:hypothetical protein